MSQRYSGGFVTKNYVAPTPSAAPGVWTLDQQMQAQKAGTWPFGGPFNYIEDVFSTYLYSPIVSNEPITISNGIDLAGKGGMVWFKKRSAGVQNHSLVDTVRGGTNLLTPNGDFAAYTASIITAFNSTGFTTGISSFVTSAPQDYASWTFRKQPKFFDIVTWTGNSTARSIAHNLGSTPGCIIVKVTNLSGENWVVWHRSINQDSKTQLFLNTTDDAVVGGKLLWGASGTNANMTSTTFSVGTATETNETGNTYVAYLFAHNAGGFGATATDNVVSCGSFTTDGSGNATVNLGYEPQWILWKASAVVDNWNVFDNMRGMTVGGSDARLFPNLSNAENIADRVSPTATGFNPTGLNTSTPYIYIAIRRGPMKVPTDGTKVFNTAFRTTGSPNFIAGFPVDMSIYDYRPGGGGIPVNISRLTNTKLITSDISAESANVPSFNYDQQLGYGSLNGANTDVLSWMFQRAPGFFDVVCYTGTGVARTVAHNLTVVPELMIVKARSTTGPWNTYVAPLGPTTALYLETTGSVDVTGRWNSTTPTSTVFSVSANADVNGSGTTYVAYLFATCPGVSKVGSYTGTGASQVINCGFTAGARFVLIKRTDSTGDWYTYDTARGMVSGTDPYLWLNTTAAEVNADYVFTSTTGFTIQAAAPAEINASGGTYIFLAIS